MPDSNYKFNPETLQFERKELTKTQKLLLSGLSIFIGSVFIFLVILITYALIYEAGNKKKNEGEYALLEEQYNILLERKRKNDLFLSELIEKDKKIYQAVFKTSPDNSVFDIQNPFAKFSDRDIKTIYNENKTRLLNTKEVVDGHKNLYADIIKLVGSKDDEFLRSIPSIQPIYNKNIKYPVYGFGEKIDHVYKALVFHPGVDFAAPEGTKVFATAKGKVVKAGRLRGLGNRIVIDHENGYKTLYAHLDEINVYVGKVVDRGDKIGTIGLTGKTLIPHLHYEVEYNGKQVNPINYFFTDLNPEEHEKIIQQSARSGLSLD
jgi:murein DD-endopeptidase MepM/ murein hydrolase activator NlpD